MNQNLILAVNNFEAHLRYERRLSGNTVIAYLTDVRQLSDFLLTHYDLTDVAQISAIHLRSWLADLKGQSLSNRSLKRKIASLNTFFHYLMTASLVNKNIAGQLLLPKTDKPLPQYLEERQTEMLEQEISFPDTFEGFTQRLIIELLYQTGMRRAELIALKERDLNFLRKEIQVLGKGGKMRILPLHDDLLTALKNYLELKQKTFGTASENVLSLVSGKPLYPNYVYRVVKMYLSLVTTLEKKSPHILRHTFASQLLNNGADLMSIKDLLGHASLAATQVYTHVNIERLKKVYQQAHPKS